jgi:hypothetical protein
VRPRVRRRVEPRGIATRTAKRALPWLACTSLGACAPADELPVVATGRYIEIASGVDLPICGGTVEFMDGILEEAFAFLGEAPPDRVFIR